MKALIAGLLIFFSGAAVAAEQPQPAATGMHRYIVERTFPRGALDNLDKATKDKVNANNATVGVRWLQSYTNADKTKTYCVYEGPNEAAVRKAAQLNALPVDTVTEVPVDLESGTSSKAEAAVAKK